MKQFKHINKVILVIMILGLSWLLPQIWHLITDEATRYPFTYFSSVNHTFCTLEYEKEEFIRKDAHGNTYTEEQWDSILPMFSFRQLATDGLLPDTLNGIELNVKDIRKTNYYFRYKPNELFSPSIPLYPLFESMSGRVDLEMPGDVFRVTKDGVAFINPKTNKINFTKSLRYSKPLLDKGFRGPAKWVAGSPTTRKSYDEGYFILDQNSRLFHFKRVNDKAFVKEIKIPENIDPIFMKTTEYGDKRFYGFVISSDSKLYVISCNKYKFINIPVHFDYKNDNIMLMANLFYWNIGITTDSGKVCYAINTNDFSLVDTLRYHKEPNKMAEASKYFLPFTLKFKSYKSNYIKPQFSAVPVKYILANLFFVILLVPLKPLRKRKPTPLAITITLITGIYGFITTLLLRL